MNITSLSCQRHEIPVTPDKAAKRTQSGVWACNDKGVREHATHHSTICGVPSDTPFSREVALPHTALTSFVCVRLLRWCAASTQNGMNSHTIALTIAIVFNSQLSDKHPRTLLVFGIVGLALQLPFLHQGHAYETEQAGHQDGAEQAPAL